MTPSLAIPPAELIYLATAGRDENVFLATGLADRDHVAGFLEAENVRPSKSKIKVLDWGCGCGRIARHWQSEPAVELFGCDVAAVPVRWCEENLSFGQFSISGHDPPLPYPSSYFDAIYAASVLTHLTFDSQFRWMQEIWRILKPTGVAVLTASGATLIPKTLPHLAANIARTFVTLIDEEMFLCVDDEVGSNSVGVVQSRGVTERMFFPFSIINYRPRFGLMGIQDTYVLKKKRDAKLTVREGVFEAPMGGCEFRTQINMELSGAGTLLALATVPDLLYPARIAFGIGESVSRPESLPMMVQWTGLTAAFCSVILDNIPAQSGTSLIDVSVTSNKPLDGRKLQIQKLVSF